MRRVQFSSAVLHVFLWLACSLALHAQKIPNPFSHGDKSEKKEADSALDRMNSREFYDDMKTFAAGLYKQTVGEGEMRTDSPFKKKVDTQYEELRRQHQERAFET